jgi:hypothetical protein
MRSQHPNPGQNAGIKQREDDDTNDNKPNTPHATLQRRPKRLRYFGKLQIDPRRIEQTPPHHRPPWIELTNNQYDFELCSIGGGASGERFRQETARILENKYKHHIKIYTDGSKKEDRVGYSVIWNQQKIKKKNTASEHDFQRRTRCHFISNLHNNGRAGKKN